ncbi:unnamed protein product, partial [Ixodes pacificus]
MADEERGTAYYIRLRGESRLSWSPGSNRRKPHRLQGVSGQGCPVVHQPTWVCDHEARFLHCSAGDPGSAHDARMYRRSELPTILTSDKFPFDSHLLGDGAYPLRQSLLVPCRNNGRLTEQHRKYGTRHATTRVAIERAFGILRGRFRRPKYIEARRPERIVTTIVADCVMHNACI